MWGANCDALISILITNPNPVVTLFLFHPDIYILYKYGFLKSFFYFLFLSTQLKTEMIRTKLG